MPQSPKKPTPRALSLSLWTPTPERPCLSSPTAREQVDAVVGFEKYADIGPRIEEIITKSGYAMPSVEVGSTDVPFRPEWERYRITQLHAGYLRVAGDF